MRGARGGAERGAAAGELGAVWEEQRDDFSSKLSSRGALLVAGKDETREKWRKMGGKWRKAGFAPRFGSSSAARAGITQELLFVGFLPVFVGNG